jgi:hypothetical protein
VSKYTVKTKVFSLFIISSIGFSAAVLGCGDDPPETLDEYVTGYGNRVDTLREASENHHREVAHATSPEKIAEAEKRYHDVVNGIFDEMHHAIDDMEDCAHGREHGPGTETLQADIEAVGELRDEHHRQMAEVHDLDVAAEHEEGYRRGLENMFRAMENHHDEMMVDADSCLCGPMHGNGAMMDHMMH